MLNFVPVEKELPKDDILVLVKIHDTDKVGLAEFRSITQDWVVQEFMDSWYTSKGYVKSWAYIDSDKTSGFYQELAKANQEINTLELLLNERQKLLDAIPECPEHGKCVPYAIDWIKDKIRQGQRIKQEEDTTKLMHEISEFVKEMKNAPKSDNRNLTELEIREIVKDEIRQGQRVEQKADEYKIISITPIMDSKSKWPYSYFDISVYGEKPKIFTRYTNGNWATVEGYLPESESKKLEKLYKKMMGFNG